MPTPATLSRREKPRGINHHIWINNAPHGRVWWIDYTIYPCPITKHRVRKSLGTKCVHEARRKRDALFATLG